MVVVLRVSGVSRWFKELHKGVHLTGLLQKSWIIEFFHGFSNPLKPIKNPSNGPRDRSGWIRLVFLSPGSRVSARSDWLENASCTFLKKT